MKPRAKLAAGCASVVTGLMLVSSVFLTTASAASPATVQLGTAGSFAVLAGQTITNTGPTTISGDVGLSPGNAVTGFDDVSLTGTLHVADAVAGEAQNDLTIAYNDAAGRPCDQTLTGQDLGDLTLVGGVYCFASSAQLTGELTLDAEGNPDAVFIFKIGSTLTTASAATVNLINGANPCNVFWQVGSSATLGTGSRFVGNILALTSITLNTDAHIDGSALARNGSVTLDTNEITSGACPPTPTPTATPTPTPTATPTPTPTPTATPTPTLVVPPVPPAPSAPLPPTVVFMTPPAAAASSPTAAESSTPAPAPAAATGDGRLPRTGPDAPSVPMAALGVWLMAAGLLLVASGHRTVRGRL